MMYKLIQLTCFVILKIFIMFCLWICFIIYYFNISITCYKNKNYNGAIQALTKLTYLIPDHPTIYYNLGVCYDFMGDYTNAIVNYHKSLQKGFDKPEAIYHNLGNIYDEMGNRHKAILFYNKAIQINPKFAPTYYNLGITYIKMGNYKDAIKYFKKVIKLSKNPDLRNKAEKIIIIIRLNKIMN